MTFVMKHALRAVAVASALVVSMSNAAFAENDNSKPATDKAQTAQRIATEGNEAIKGAFAWGADAGGSIDMSSNDMSSIDFTAYFGYKRGWINFIGIGAEIDIMISNSSRSFPVYLSFKTNFRNKPTLLFMDVRGGISTNYLPSDYSQSGAYCFAGLGINLARGRKFSSHIIIGYTYKQYSNFVTRDNEGVKMNDVHLASVRLGVTF